MIRTSRRSRDARRNVTSVGNESIPRGCRPRCPRGSWSLSFGGRRSRTMAAAVAGRTHLTRATTQCKGVRAVDKRNLQVRQVRVGGAALVVLVATLVGPGGTVAQAAAAGCTSDRPTFIGGSVYGYADGRSLNALIGYDLHNASGQKVDLDGVLCT